MKLYILRHAEAEPIERTEGGDKARVLTERGRETALKVAQGMRRLNFTPGMILTSPYPRAAETARITAEVLGCEGQLQQREEMAAGVRPNKLIKMINKLEAPPGELMLVGHNPDLELLVTLLVGGGDLVLKKSGLALVNTGDPVEKGGGQLQQLWQPKHLGLIGA